MKVGDYVRTKSGKIVKCFKSESMNKPIYYVIGSATNSYIEYQDVVKSSPNIIDLIEVGDYVNGKKVIKVWEEPFGEFAGQIFTILEGEATAPTIRDIKSIVTKEQFESMKYRIEE